VNRLRVMSSRRNIVQRAEGWYAFHSSLSHNCADCGGMRSRRDIGASNSSIATRRDPTTGSDSRARSTAAGDGNPAAERRRLLRILFCNQRRRLCQHQINHLIQVALYHRTTRNR
jgi:hypothetical protein